MKFTYHRPSLFSILVISFKETAISGLILILKCCLIPYASGHEGDWFLVGFSPRVQALTVYIMSGFDAYLDLSTKLGKFKTGKSYLFIKKLEDISEQVHKKFVAESVLHMKKTNS